MIYRRNPEARLKYIGAMNSNFDPWSRFCFEGIG